LCGALARAALSKGEGTIETGWAQGRAAADGRLGRPYHILPRFSADRHVGKEGYTMRLLSNFLRDTEAATAVEYAVMLALILVAIMGAIGSVGMRAGGMWGGIIEKLRAVGFF
jgi:pilus assembly protein Flp/PilA